MRVQPDAIADSGSHAGADSWPYAIADREPDASADRRPDAGAHTEARSQHGPGGFDSEAGTGCRQGWRSDASR